MWEKQKDISPELVKEFEANYQENHLGVRLLKKRVLRRRVKYLIEWKVIQRARIPRRKKLP